MLCICLDDFGLSPGVNQAALDLAEQGRLQAISCMVGADFFREGVAGLRRAADSGVDIGLHLDLTEKPLLAASRQSLRGLIVGSLLGRLDRASLRLEIRAQLDAFEQTLGCSPSYIDGHQHVHQFRGIRDELLDELDGRARAGKEPWLRSTRSAPGGDWQTRFKPAVIERLGDAALRAAAQRRGYRMNAHLLGVYDFEGGAKAYAAHLQRWLQMAGNGDLLMCHAGLGQAPDDPIAQARQAEFEVLSSQDFADLLDEHQIRLQAISRTLAGPSS